MTRLITTSDAMTIAIPGNSQSLAGRLGRALVAWPAFAALLLAACGPDGQAVRPQILAMNYKVVTFPDGDATLAQIRDGQSRIVDLMASEPCNFTANVAASSPRIRVGGTPGTSGFNVTLVSTTPSPIASDTPNPANCSALAEIEINIGSNSEALALNETTSKQNGRIVLADGKAFDTSAFFEAKVTGYASTDGQTSGDFRFVNRLPADSNTLLIVDGSFSLMP